MLPGRLAAGAHPHADDRPMGAHGVEGLMAAGVTAFVDLTQAAIPGTGDSHLVPYADAARRMDPAVVVVAHPIPDLGTPTVDQATAILDCIDQLLDEGRSVFIHCWGGVGRAGVVVGCWLVRHRLASAATVLETLAGLRAADLSAHRRSPETDEQRRFVTDWGP